MSHKLKDWYARYEHTITGKSRVVQVKAAARDHAENLGKQQLVVPENWQTVEVLPKKWERS